MDLTNLKSYVDGKGDPLTLSATDSNLPQELRDFLRTLPNRQVTLSPGSSGIALQGSTLVIAGTSTDAWPIQGMENVVISLSAVNITITDGSGPVVIDATVHAALPFTPTVSAPVVVTALHQDANPWRITLARKADTITPTNLLLLGKAGTLPFDIPSNLDVLEQALVVDPDRFQILFYPNTTYEAWWQFQLSAPKAKWPLIADVLSFDGIDIQASVSTNGLAVVLIGHLIIDRIGVDVGVSLNTGDNWVAFVRPTTGNKFPGIAALARWIAGSGSTLADDTSSGFSALQFDVSAFDLALAAVTIGFNYKKTSLNYLDIKSLLTIGGMQLDVVLRLPDLAIIGSLHESQPVKVKDMLTSFELAADSVPDNLSITAVEFAARARQGFYSAGMTVDNPWQAGPVALEQVSVLVSYFKGEGFTGQFNAKLGLGATTKLELEAQYAGVGTGWIFAGGTAVGSSLKIGDLISELDKKFGVSTPDALKSFVLTDLMVTFVTNTKAFTYHAAGQFELAGQASDLTIDFAITKNKEGNGFALDVKGDLNIGAAHFLIAFDKTPGNCVMTGTWEKKSGSIGFRDIAQAFGFTPPDIPEELDPRLKSASLTYDFTKSKLTIGLASENFGNAIFAALKNEKNKKWQFFFGLATGKSIGLTTIPLVSNFLPPEDTVAIDKIQVLVSSDAIDGTLAGALNNLIGTDYPPVPSAGMSKGLGFSMSVNFGSTQFPIMLGTGASQPALKAAQPAVATDLPVTSGSASPGGLAQSPPTSDGVVWFNVQKTFGPVSIQKIGVRYKDGVLVVLMNMSLTASGLTIGLLGFGIGSPISTFDPKFEIQGLDVSYVGGGLQVSGGLVGTIDPVNFVGQLRIDAQGFGLGALGGYTMVENHPSLFLYVALNAPLGGPACFFVTGLAGGFGFNRDLKLPDVSGIATFPLVQMATGQKPTPMKMSGDIGQQVNGVLNSLSDIVAPAVGKYWLAAGIKFTSFQLVNSFALAIVKFGGEFEIDIMGMSTLSIPVGAPVVYAELQLLASFKPKEGFIGVSGQLTPRSYLFAPECHLTGGFAFFLWFSGEHQGDFVITLGGYNPKLPKPTHYPTVPRVGVNWQVSDKLSIKGECYCAITSSAVMMGGRLSATWNSDGISAWFTMQVDFLMFYLPFHYYAKASVDIGATFNVNLTFTRLTITAHVGATLEIWGPEFTGKAIVDLDIISFPIRFGATQRKIETQISWSEFTKKVLLSSQSSQDKKQPVKRAAAGNVAAAKDDISRSILHFNVSGGLIKQLGEQGKDEIYIVNAETLELTVTTSIPIKESKCAQPFQGLIKLADKQPPEIPNEAFGVGPVGKGDTEFSPTFNITVEQDKAPSKKPVLQATRLLGRAPKALWQKAACDNNGVPTIANPLQDTTIANVVTGYKMAPIAQPAEKTLPIDLQRLQDTGDPNIQQYAWSAPFVPTADTFKDQTTVEQTIMDKTAQKNRTVMLTALKDFIAPLDTSVDVGNLADPARFDLLAEPQMRLLGEQKASAQ